MKWQFLADENFNNIFLRRIRQQLPDLDIVRVQDVGLLHSSDPAILEWAATVGRILLTHDLATIPDFAYNRLNQGLALPGVFIVPGSADADLVLEDFITIIESSQPEEWANLVTFLPL
jgi:hypothetical protein